MCKYSYTPYDANNKWSFGYALKFTTISSSVQSLLLL